MKSYFVSMVEGKSSGQLYGPYDYEEARSMLSWGLLTGACGNSVIDESKEYNFCGGAVMLELPGKGYYVSLVGDDMKVGCLYGPYDYDKAENVLSRALILDYVPTEVPQLEVGDSFDVGVGVFILKPKESLYVGFRDNCENQYQGVGVGIGGS